MNTTKVLAWHFTAGMKLRDGQPLVVGKTYRHTGELEMCMRGYHASIDIRDALSYAPGFQVSRVECSGDMVKQSDKLVCRNRKVLWTLEAKAIILKWSMRVATDAVKIAKKVCTNKAWNAWAELWISGKDRSYAAADAASAAYSAYAYAASAAYSAAYSAASAANSAAYSAYAYAAASASAAASAASAAADAREKASKKYTKWLLDAIESAHEKVKR